MPNGSITPHSCLLLAPPSFVYILSCHCSCMKYATALWPTYIRNGAACNVFQHSVHNNTGRSSKYVSYHPTLQRASCHVHWCHCYMQPFFYEMSLSFSAATVAASVSVSFMSFLVYVPATASKGSDDCYTRIWLMFQVFILEEIGLVSAEMFAVMDLVLRRLRESPVPFGGIFLLGSGDPLQLPPIKGHAHLVQLSPSHHVPRLHAT